MPLVATQPLRLGNRICEPGYELTPDDLRGRNVDLMKRHGHVTWVAEDEKPTPRRRQPRSQDDE